jgi:hypothetical protein
LSWDVLIPYHLDYIDFYMQRHGVMDGGDGPHIWRVAGNILNKLVGTADKGCSSSLVLGEEVKYPDNKKNSLLRNIIQELRIGELL